MQNLQEVQTKFGIIYIEQLGNQEEEDRIKIYDSRKSYIDYVSLGFLELKASVHNIHIATALQYRVEDFQSCESIEQLFEMLTLNISLITTDWKEAINFLGCDDITTEEALVNNEWVNTIGNNYIILATN